MSDTFDIRLATLADLELISWHRARMFRDMGDLPPELFEAFRAQSKDKLHRMFEQGEYIGWLISPENKPERIVAGAGVQLREVAPHPLTKPSGEIVIAKGRQALIINVFTEPEWRRRGLAALLIRGLSIGRVKNASIHSFSMPLTRAVLFMSDSASSPGTR